MPSVSIILMFIFCHRVNSGVSCYSCLCLEIVPLVILLPSISRPGRLALSSEFQWSEHSLQASCPLTGKVHRYLVFGPLSWPKMKAQNRTFPRICVALAVTEAVVSVVHTLTCADYFLQSPRTKMALLAALNMGGVSVRLVRPLNLLLSQFL